SGNTVWNRIFRLVPDSVVIQECSDIQQVSKVYFVVFAEIFCEQMRISDIAPDYFRPNVIIDEVCARYIQCGLVIICAYKEKRMVFEHFSAQRMPLDGFKDVLYESSITTAHIQNAFWLQVNWLVENRNNEVCHYFEIGGVRA